MKIKDAQALKAGDKVKVELEGIVTSSFKLSGGVDIYLNFPSLDESRNYNICYWENENVDDENDAFLVVEVGENIRDDKAQIRLTLQKGDVKYAIDLNKTNSIFCKIEGKITHPSQLEGKKLFFRKVKAYSPNAKKEVDSLRICKIE